MSAGQGAITGNILDRMVRASRLEEAVYEEVEHDKGATTQAALVVIVTSLAAGIGSIVDLGIGGLVFITIAGVIGWALYAYITYFVGTRLLAGPETSADWGELARALGFANSPRILLILGVVPVLAGIVGLVVLVWVLIATVIAIRAALDFSTGRAIGTAVIGWIVQVIIYAAVYALLGA